MLFFRILKRLFWGKKYLEASLVREIESQIKKSQNLSEREQIIHYDIMYHKLLLGLGYTGSFGEILKRNPKEIKHIQEIWKLHKLRNSLVHELQGSENLKLSESSKKFQIVIKDFMKQYTSK